MLRFLLPAALLAAVAAGCTPSGQCQSLADCEAGQVCAKDGTCVADPNGNGGPPPPPSDGGSNPQNDAGNVVPGDAGPDAGGGFVDDEIIEVVDEAVVSLFPDPRPGHEGEILFSEYLVGGVDRATTLDPVTGDVGAVAFDFQNEASSPCKIDSLREELDSNVEPVVDELWFTCATGSAWRVVYDEDLSVGIYTPPGSAAVTASFPREGDADRYRLVAARGGTELSSVKLVSQGIAEQEARETTPVVDVQPWVAIVQIFALTPSANEAFRDFAAVFDRGDDMTDPRLVALMRDEDTDTWVPNPNLGTHTLPAGTAAVAIIGTVQTDADTNVDAPNLLYIIPGEGAAHYVRWEDWQMIGDHEVVFETNGNETGGLPPATDKILLEARPGVGLFYASTTASRAWRIPFDPEADDDVFTVIFDASTDLPNGMVVFDDTHVWYSFQGQNELRRLELIQ